MWLSANPVAEFDPLYPRKFAALIESARLNVTPDAQKQGSPIYLIKLDKNSKFI